MVSLACWSYGSGWVSLLREFPFLHSWLLILTLWVGVAVWFRGRGVDRPMEPWLYLVLTLAPFMIDPALCAPVLGLFVLRLLWTTFVRDAELWLHSPLYRAFHRAVTWSVVLAIPVATLRYEFQPPTYLFQLEGAIVPWLFGPGVTLLVGAFVLARARPELLGQAPAGVAGVLQRRSERAAARRAAHRRRRIHPALRRRIAQVSIPPQPPRRIGVGAEQRCPLCHDALAASNSTGPAAGAREEAVQWTEPGDALTACVGCHTVAHSACADEFGGCGTLGCDRFVPQPAPVLSARVDKSLMARVA